MLVHKLASLLLLEDVKKEQLLMLTFSRAAVNDFKQKLINLIGPAAYYVEIKTFHSYCFDLLGRIGTLDKSDQVVRDATDYIINGDAEKIQLEKTVLVIDEAQDMDANEYALVQALIMRNEDMRVIAVGDDDQNIYEFRHSDSRYMREIMKYPQSTMYELIENYRRASNLVEFTNWYVKQIKNRMKRTMIQAYSKEYGNIRIKEYQTQNIVTPAIIDLINNQVEGSTLIATPTNEMAWQVVTLWKIGRAHV